MTESDAIQNQRIDTVERTMDVVAKATTSVEYKELRFIFHPEITRVYIWIHVISGDPMLGIEGWHTKSFPKNMSAVDIMVGTVTDSPVLWPVGGPGPESQAF